MVHFDYNTFWQMYYMILGQYNRITYKAKVWQQHRTIVIIMHIIIWYCLLGFTRFDYFRIFGFIKTVSLSNQFIGKSFWLKLVLWNKFRISSKYDGSSPSCHVGCYGNRAQASCLCYDFSFLVVLLCI